MKILIQNGQIVDVVNGTVSPKDVLIEGNRIAKIKEHIAEASDKKIDASGMVLMPGLVNCHHHAGMNLFRGYSDDLELQEWLQKAIWPIEEKLTREDVYYSNLLACIEMIKSGTTMFNDMYYFSEELAKAVEETGIRAMISNTVILEGEEADSRLKKAEELYLAYHNVSSGKIKVAFSLHAPYTCPPSTIQKVVALSEKHDSLLHVHLSETEKENVEIQNLYGKSPTAYLAENGVFTRPCILAHGVHLANSDLEIIKSGRAGISHNPISNCKLASGIADIVSYRSLGIPVGLGTDGAGSTNTLDMFEEMKMASFLQKLLHKSASCISARDIIKMATIEGAKLFRMETEIGSIEEGKLADIILIDMKKAELQPVHDIFSTLVYSCTGSDVHTSIINGNIVMENRTLVASDETKAIIKVNEIVKRYF